jgi:hypothetical protein
MNEAQLSLIRPFRSEIAMSRVILISSLAWLLAACSAPSDSHYHSVDHGDWAQEGLACADVGIAPGSEFFNRCVTDLHNALWAEYHQYQS